MALSHIHSVKVTTEAATETNRALVFYCRSDEEDELLSLIELLSLDPMDQAGDAVPVYSAQVAPLLHDRGPYRLLAAACPPHGEAELQYVFDHAAAAGGPKPSQGERHTPNDLHRNIKRRRFSSSLRPRSVRPRSPAEYRHNSFSTPAPVKRAESGSSAISHALGLCCARRLACLEHMHEQNGRTLRLLGQARQEIEQSRLRYGQWATRVDVASTVFGGLEKGIKEAWEYLEGQKVVRRAAHRAGKELLTWVANQKALHKAARRALTILLTTAAEDIGKDVAEDAAKTATRKALKEADEGTLWDEIGGIGHVLMNLGLEYDSPSYWATVVTTRKDGLGKALGADAEDVEDQMADSEGRLDEAIRRLSEAERGVRNSIAAERSIKYRALRKASTS